MPSLCKSIPLDNGLTLEIRDASLIIAGDRWLVRIEARMAVPLREEDLDPLPEKATIYAILARTFGRKVPFLHVEERHFVDREKKEDLVRSLIENLCKNILPYVGHPEFSKRFVLSRYLRLKRQDPRLFLGA